MSTTNTHRPDRPGSMLLTLIVGLMGLCLIAWAIGISQKSQGETLRPVPDARFKDAAMLAPATGLTFDGVVSRVIDGDTLIVQRTSSVRVRLIDCWVAESRTKDLAEKALGLKAKARLAELATGKPVRVHVPIGEDLSKAMTLGRVLGHVWPIEDGVPRREDYSDQANREGWATKTKAPKEKTP